MKAKLQELICEFEHYDLHRLSSYLHLVSSKVNDDLFPPYIPRVGAKYEKHKILMYATAQNIPKLWEDLSKKDRKQKVMQLFEEKDYRKVWMEPYRVMLALAGVFLYVESNEILENLSEIDKHIAATNYYKFSLNRNRKDINPNTILPKLIDANEYWDINNELSYKELKVLEPKIILSFKGVHNRFVKSKGYRLHEVNNASWILRGGSGCLKKGGSWEREVYDDSILKLVGEYLLQIKDAGYRYAGKIEAVKIYLLKYYHEWKNQKREQNVCL